MHFQRKLKSSFNGKLRLKCMSIWWYCLILEDYFSGKYFHSTESNAGIKKKKCISEISRFIFQVSYLPISMLSQSIEILQATYDNCQNQTLTSTQCNLG